MSISQDQFCITSKGFLGSGRRSNHSIIIKWLQSLWIFNTTKKCQQINYARTKFTHFPWNELPPPTQCFSNFKSVLKSQTELTKFNSTVEETFIMCFFLLVSYFIFKKCSLLLIVVYQSTTSEPCSFVRPPGLHLKQELISLTNS
jgi:hypothetical protein